MIALVGAMVISRIAQGWLGGGLIPLAAFGSTIATFFCLVLVVNSFRRLRIVAGVLVFCAVFLSVQALTGYYLGFDTRRFVIGQTTENADDDDAGVVPQDDAAQMQEDAQVQVEGPGSEEGLDDGEAPALYRLRSVGFLADPNDFSEALVMVIPILGLAWKNGKALRNLFVVLIPGAILLYAIYLAHSRGSLIGLGILVFAVCAKRWGPVRAAIVAADSRPSQARFSSRGDDPSPWRTPRTPAVSKRGAQA